MTDDNLTDSERRVRNAILGMPSNGRPIATPPPAPEPDPSGLNLTVDERRNRDAALGMSGGSKPFGKA